MHKAIWLALVIFLIQIAALFLMVMPVIAPTHEAGGMHSGEDAVYLDEHGKRDVEVADEEERGTSWFRPSGSNQSGPVAPEERSESQIERAQAAVPKPVATPSAIITSTAPVRHLAEIEPVQTVGRLELIISHQSSRLTFTLILLVLLLGSYLGTYAALRRRLGLE